MSQPPAEPSGFRPNKLPRPHQAAPAQPIPRVRLLLHNNASLELMFIVRTVMELTRFCRAEATHKMWESYHCGRSVLLTTWKERAELYVEQFAERGLTVSIEPQA